MSETVIVAPALGSDSRSSLALRLTCAALERLSVGRLELQVTGQPSRLFEGKRPGPHAFIQIHDLKALDMIMARGDAGFAEAYIAGLWGSPDLADLLEFCAVNQNAIESLLHGKSWFRVARWLWHHGRRNSRRGSKRNIVHHYDLGNDFFAAWLDPAMQYSAGLYDGDDDSLESAQARKIDRILTAIDPEPGDHILEIGCGWGGFAIEAARRTGCRVTGITLSPAQLDLARQQVSAAGLNNCVDLRLQDYRDVDERFDHVVSIEMFEAVGEDYWPLYFEKLRQCLRPGGRAFVQVITIDESRFSSYRSRVDFIQRNIFPGGMLPTRNVFSRQARAAGLVEVMTDMRGGDYGRTLADWHERFLSSLEAVASLGYDEAFQRMWRYYLAYCEAGFRTGRIDLMQTLWQHP